MSSRIPTVKQIAWISIVPQIIFFGFLVLFWYQISKSYFLIISAVSYLIISQMLRRIITKEHRKGMICITGENYEKGIPHFQNSYEYFKKNDWIDKYRYLTLLSSTKPSYKELALNNIAFCYGQIGMGKMSKKYYEQLLEEYPDNRMAEVALRMLNSMMEEE